MVEVVTPMVDCSGGAPAPNSGDRGANVDGGEVAGGQWEEVGVVVCLKRAGVAGLNRLHGVLRELTGDDGGQGALADQRRGRGHGGVQGAQSIVMRVPAQEEVVKHSVVRAVSIVMPTAVVVVHGGSRSRAVQRACLAGF